MQVGIEAAGIVILVGALILAVVRWRAWAAPPQAVVSAIEQHLASEGAVMFVSRAWLNFGSPPAGTRQYRVAITTLMGLSRTHTVEVDAAGAVRTVL